MPETQPKVDTLNFRKFQTKNPIARLTIDGFYRRLAETVRNIPAQSILDAGCGEGETLERLRDLLPPVVVGFDLNPDSVAYAAQRFPKGTFTVENVYHLPYPDQNFDLVLCLEVLEHLERPTDALRELARVARMSIVVSVPNEPWFQLGNLARGKYLNRLGDHPEHVQHWNRRTFRLLFEQVVPGVTVHSAFPWLIGIGQKPGKTSP
jgi:ubiquinone/menaquinone biosynthesis C-methylase UbiE